MYVQVLVFIHVYVYNCDIYDTVKNTYSQEVTFTELWCNVTDMTATMEGALDLSVRDYDCKVSSPAPSMSPDPTDHNHSGERSSSVSSESQETDGSLTTKVEPLSPGQLHRKPMPPLLAVSTSPPRGDGSPGLCSPKIPGDPSVSPDESRPFKMYPFDSLSGMYSQMAAAAAAASTSQHMPQMTGFPASPVSQVSGSGMVDSSVSISSPIGQYLQQRRRRYEARVERQSIDSNEKKPKVVPDNEKDDSYWERRRKNNEAAKRSRDARRAKEEEIALRAAFLEQENLKLRAQVAILKNETAKLHYMLYNRM